MPELPFEIPESLSSYADQFDKDPNKAINRLQKQLKKRGPDAVGHFLLSWLFHLKGMDEKAVDEALKAKIFAPGSPFFEKLHYYLSHPKMFDAWTPDASSAVTKRKESGISKGPVLDLDNLIQKLSSIDSNKIKPKSSKSPEKEGEQEIPDDVDNIVSETLAIIHEKQGKLDAAIQAYRRLKDINKNKRDHYDEKIKILKAEKEKENKEEKE